MAVTAAQLVAKVSTEGVSAAKSDLKSVGDSASNTGSIFKSALGGGLSFATGLAGKALSFLKDQLSDSIKVAMAHQDVMTQTAQAIKSTGDASGLSASSIADLADSLSHVTNFSDDTIQSGENLLLTFTGIGKTVFPQATQTMLDMAQAMHTGPTQEAMLLGKALNDPTTGLTALQRVGVTFSASEKEQIATMMAHNDVAGAQKVMLQELATEFGGSATAAGKTFSGQLGIMKNDLEDVKQKIGTALLPVLANLTGMFTSILMPILEKFADWIGSTAIPNIQKLSGVFSFIGDVLRTIPLNDFREAWMAVSGEIGIITRGFGNLIPNIKSTGDSLEPVGDVIRNIASGGLKIITGLLWDFSAAFIAVDRSLQSGSPPLQGLGPIFIGVGGAVRTLLSAFQNVSPVSNLIQAFSSHAQELGKWFQTSVIPALKGAEPGFKNLMQALVGLLPVVSAVSVLIHTVFQAAFTALLPVFEKVIPLVIQIAGIVANVLGAAIKFLTPYVIQATNVLSDFAQEILSRVTPILLQLVGNIQSGLNIVLQIWHAVWPTLAPILAGVWTEIQGIIQIAFSIIRGIVLIALDILSGNWKQAWQDFQNMLVGVWAGIQTYVSGALQVLQATVGNALISLASLASGWGSDIINGIVSGIEGAIGNVESAANNVANTIKSILHFSKPDIGPLVDFDSWMPDMMDGLAKGMNDNLSKVKSATLNVASSLVIAPQSPLQGVGGLAIIPQSVSASVQASGQGQPIILQIDGHTFARGLLPYTVNNVRNSVGAKF